METEPKLRVGELIKLRPFNECLNASESLRLYFGGEEGIVKSYFGGDVAFVDFGFISFWVSTAWIDRSHEQESEARDE